MIENKHSYSVAIRTLGLARNKYQILLDSLANQTIKPEKIFVFIAEGYNLPEETIGVEHYIYVKKGMVAQRALAYEEIDSEYILFLDDDVYLPVDGVEKLFKALAEYSADVVSPDVFPNAERPLGSKIQMAVSGRMRPRKDDKKWAYKVMRNSGYSYNTNPSLDVYESQTNAGPCFLCSKKDFLKIKFQEEMWLEECSYPLGEDQVMFYKMYLKGLKQLTLFHSGIVHMDAGTTLGSLDKERKKIYSDFRFKTIFWHRFVFLPHKGVLNKIIDILAILYTFTFALIASLVKGRIDILKLKIDAILGAVNFIKSSEYKSLPRI